MPPKIVTIDCDYLEPRFAAAFLWTDGQAGVFIENNTAHAVPRMLEALRGAGLTPAQVRHAVITHVHLDHAAGSSALLEACADARLYAHPKAARHVIDPARLVASARQVYGAAKFAELYGEIRPVPAARVEAVDDGDTLAAGSGRFRFLHTRGHANHHVCVYEETTGAIFTGDSFGVAYPALQTDGLFILPSTSPTDFDAEAALASVDRILETGARSAYLTHFGELRQLAQAAAQLREWLEFAGELVLRARGRELDEPARTEFCRTAWDAQLERVLARRGTTFNDRQRSLLNLDLQLNAAGLAWAARPDPAPAVK